MDWKSRDAEQCPHSESPCPAKGKLCYACEKMKHFASICRSKCKSVNQIEEKQHAVKIEILMKNIDYWLLTEMLTDTGSSTNITDEGTLSKLKDYAD